MSSRDARDKERQRTHQAQLFKTKEREQGALKEREKLQIAAAAKFTELRALRLAKEAADKEAAEKAAAEVKPAKPKKKKVAVTEASEPAAE